MSTEDLNENNNLSSQNQENSESITNIYNSIDFYYNIKINEKPIFETKIILDFKKNLIHAIVIEDISDKEGKEELIKDLLNNYTKYDWNEASKKLQCNMHACKYNKYCIKCRENYCEKCLDEKGHKDEEDFIKLEFEKDFNILLNNFLNKTIKEDKIEYKFHNIVLALCNTFQCCPHIENYISLKNAIKLIIEIDNLFYYTKDDSKFEDLNRELLKEKMIIFEINLENKLNKKIVYCNCCNSSIQFEFFSENQIKKFCEAKEKIEINDCQQYIKTDILKYFLQNDDEQSPFDYKNMYCILHKKKKFLAYCTDCRKNLCEDCIMQFNEKTHNIKIFEPSSFNIKKFIKYGYKFCRFINAIVNTIKEYPNIYSYKSLESAEKLLTGKNNNLNEEKFEVKDFTVVKEFFLLSKRKNKDNKNYFENIKTINLDTKNIRSLNYFKNLKYLINLRQLKLRENGINSIKWLLKCKFLHNLQILDLGSNNLGDYNIKYFKELFIKEQLCNLEELYLYKNMFQSFTLFDFIQFPKLKILYLGNNLFRNNKNNKVDKDKKYNFSKLKSIGLNGVFRKGNKKEENKEEDTITLLKNMNLVSLNALYLQNNDIDSLTLLNDLKITNNKLLTIYLTNNNLTEIDIDVLLKFENLEKILVDENKISEIKNKEKLKEFKRKNKKLVMNLSLNNLDKETKDELKNISNDFII